MSKIRQLVIPTEIYTSGHEKLSADLEKLAKKLSKRKISKAKCLKQGLESIEGCYLTQLNRFNRYVKRKKLVGVEGTEASLLDAKKEAIKAWTEIVSDL